MDKFKLIEAGINYDDGLRRFVNKTAMYENYLMKFLKDTHYQDMLTAIENGNVKSAFETAHALKGVVGTLGMDSLFQNMVPLVNLFRAGGMEGCEALLRPVKQEYERVVEVLEQEGHVLQ